MNRTLITGGAGFIGLHLGRYLAANGHQVYLLDNFARGADDQDLRAARQDDSISFVEGDLRDPKIADTIGTDFDFIVHLAAVVGVQNVMSTPFKVLDDNASLTISAIRLARAQKRLKKFVFTSTSEVVAETLECYGIDIPTPETTPLVVADPGRPRSTYLLSKIYGEALCQHSELPFLILRPHNIYGPRMGMAHVIPELLKKAHFSGAGESIEIASPGHTRTFCYVLDAVEIIAELLESEVATNITLNLGRQEPEVTILELANIVADTASKSVKVVEGEDTAGSPKRRGPNMEKVYSLIDARPAVDLAEGVKRTYAWYLEHVFERSK